MLDACYGLAVNGAHGHRNKGTQLKQRDEDKVRNLQYKFALKCKGRKK